MASMVLNLLWILIMAPYFNNAQDAIPHKMNFNVSTSISNIQRGQFIDMYNGNPEDTPRS